MFSHFPILSAQQRLTPYADNATSVFAALGNAAPQVYFNGHDHIMASLSNPTITSNGAPIGFITTGAGGISDYGAAFKNGIFTQATYPAVGYITSSGNNAAINQLVNVQYKARPAAGTAAASSYNPDVNYTQFWSEYNGFTLTTANATMMRVDFYLVNCSAVITTGACAAGAIGPVYTQYFAAKAISSNATTYISAVVTLGGYSVSTFLAPQAAAFSAAVATDAGVAASAVTVTSVTAVAAAGRHLLQSSVSVGFTVKTTASNAVAVSGAIANGMTAAQLQAAGLSAATGATVTTAPTTAQSATAPVPAAIASPAPRAAASGALLVAAAALAAAL